MGLNIEKRKFIENQVESQEVGEEIENLEEFLKENISQVYGVIDGVRHGDTKYTGKYPDLTEKGKKEVEKTAGEIVDETLMLDKISDEAKLDDFKQDILLISSPADRARGSSKIIENELIQKIDNENVEIKNISPDPENFEDDGVVRTRNALRPLDIKEGKLQETIDMFLSSMGVQNMEEWDIKLSDYAYANKPEFEDRTDLIEPRSKVRERTVGSLSSATMILKRYKEKYNNLPHVIVTSHIETLNNIVLETFNPSKDIEDGEFLTTGEKFSLYLLQPEEADKIPMVINFRGQTRKVTFDRNEKKFE